jgi:hypothetical protein
MKKAAKFPISSDKPHGKFSFIMVLLVTLTSLFYIFHDFLIKSVSAQAILAECPVQPINGECIHPKVYPRVMLTRFTILAAAIILLGVGVFFIKSGIVSFGTKKKNNETKAVMKIILGIAGIVIATLLFSFVQPYLYSLFGQI